MTGKRLIFITGGARSGKSLLAERMADRLTDRVLYVATAEAGDEEMAARIGRHQDRRPQHWRTLESPREVVTALGIEPWDPDVVLLDCLSLWLSNLLLDQVPWQAEISSETGEVAVATLNLATEALLQWYREGSATFVVVSNEVGCGVVPATPLGRLYRDVLGLANQAVAGLADTIYYCVAGRVLDLSHAPTVGQATFE